MLESSSTGKNREFMVLNTRSRISQHDAAANKANVSQRLKRRLFYGSLSPLLTTVCSDILAIKMIQKIMND